MKNVRRYFEDGYYFFITVATQGRKPHLTRQPVIQALRNTVRTTMASHPFDIQAWVVLPDHMHLLIGVADQKVDLRIRKIKALTTRALPEFSYKNSQKNFSKRRRRQGSLWHNRFYDRIIRNEQELYMYTLYCCFNPVKHGYVKNALEWPYSTLNTYLKQGRYPESWQYITDAWVDDNFADYDMW